MLGGVIVNRHAWIPDQVRDDSAKYSRIADSSYKYNGAHLFSRYTRAGAILLNEKAYDNTSAELEICWDARYLPT